MTGGNGQTSQNLAHLRLNVLALTASSSCVLPDSSHDRNSCSSFAVLSITLVNVAPHFRHRQRWDPAFVFPNRFVPPSQ